MSPLLALLKPIAAKLLLKKATKEVSKVIESIDSVDTVKFTEEVETLVIDKKKGSAWAMVVIGLVYTASNMGYIDPAIADLVNSILSNPETVEAIEAVVE